MADTNYQNRIRGSANAENQNRLNRYTSGGIVANKFRDNYRNQTGQYSNSSEKENANNERQRFLDKYTSRGIVPRNQNSYNNDRSQNSESQNRQKLDSTDSGAKNSNETKQLSARKKLIMRKMERLRSLIRRKRNLKAKSSSASNSTATAILVVTLILAIVTDLIDVIGLLGVELAGIPLILSYLINISFSFVITMSWLYVFSGSQGHSKKQSNWLFRSFLMMFGLDSVPLIELLPFNAIAVIMNYIDYKESNK